MILRYPHPTVSLSPHEVAEAVQAYLQRNDSLGGRRVGNLTAVDLSPLVSITGANRLCGQLTFELLPESENEN